MKRPKNLLVQYRGGGYDGCFWEWNYFLFDQAGKFHVIAASGYKGIKTEAEALKLLNPEPGQKPWLVSKHHTYRLTRQADLNSFQSECSPSHVAGVVDKVNKIYGKDIMFWKCQDCDQKQYDQDMFHDGYHGDGGIGVTMDGVLCSECYCSGLCDSCHEYSSGDFTWVEGKHGEERLCQWCAESHAKVEVQS